MYYITVTVYDNRCDSGINYRENSFKTLDECIKWAKSLKNRVPNRSISTIRYGKLELHYI